jgi:hypothetical protein
MSWLKLLASVAVTDSIYQIFGDVRPNLTAHHIVSGCERNAVPADHNGVVLGVSIGVAR